MQQVTDLHRKAMELASTAHLERIRGRSAQAHDLICEASQREREAACLVKDMTELEPTRSVLFRSAASLAVECNELREAERLIAWGLAGNPPEEIADELRDLLEQVNFERHLSLRGMTLRPDEFQLSMSGPAVGNGLAQSDEFTGRVQSLQKLVYRTAARVMQLPYCERGPDKKVRKEMEVFLSVPRAACFAVSFRLGGLHQPKLPGQDLGKDVIDEVFDCIDLLNTSSYGALRKRFAEEAYYTNFVSLTHSIRPDGNRVKRVGLTSLRQDAERRVVLSEGRQREGEDIDQHIEVAEEQAEEIKGMLLVADAYRESNEYIVVVDAEQRKQRVRVPTGMMGDIVRPLFEYEVVVRGKRAGKYLLLEDIRKAE
ncbi:MAG TPA: hypothetical protein VM186_08670 [Planctomycetota bacterium]|nr:hypothetical protein [Planctomycetota bacterium]